MNQRLLLSALALGLSAVYIAPAFSQAKPDTLVRQRQAAMILIGKYFGPLNAMAQGKVPYDGAVVDRNADYVETLSKMPWDGFHASTKGEKSRALAAIFEQPDKFKQASERFQTEISKLASMGKGTDEAAVKAQITAVNKACAACHDDFRERR
jgi:cytochrome c556